MKKNNMNIILYCLNCLDYCQKASKVMIDDPIPSDTMQKTYQGLSRIFLRVGKDFENIAKIAGLELDITSQKGKIILEKINSLADLNKTQQRKCMKEISTLLVYQR